MLSQREAAARLMEHLCTHDGDGGHGYSQYAREGAGTETVDLGDGVRLTVPGGDRDCSSAIISALRAVGVDVGGATYTGNMRVNLTRNGLFAWHRWGDGYQPRRGDIYLNETHHTAMCVGGGKLAEFSISEKGTVSGKRGDQTGWESHVRAAYVYSKGWSGVLAWTSDGSTLGGKALPAALQGYTDLDANAWYVGAVEKAVVNGWMGGYAGTTRFGPSDALTRAQAVCVIARAAKAQFDHPFSDVTASPYYYDAVAWAKAQGIVTGSAGEFRPTNACTRAELCAMVYRWKKGGAAPQPALPDWSDVPEWARDAVAWAVSKKAVGNGGRIRPNDACTRAECAAILGAVA